MGSLHPAIVHIPIGLLLVYSLFEMFSALFPESWKQFTAAKSPMLFIGLIGGLFALSSGDALSESYPTIQVLELHELFAQITMWLYGILGFTLVGIPWLERIKWPAVDGRIMKILLSMHHFFARRTVRFIIAGVGLLALTITGALGGAMTHGSEADPLTSFVTSILLK